MMTKDERTTHALQLMIIYIVSTLGLVLACGIGFFGGAFVSLGVEIALKLFLPAATVREFDSAGLYWITLYVPITVLFGAAIGLIQGAPMLSFLAGNSRINWLIRSIVAGIVYWLVADFLRYYLLSSDTLGLVSSLQKTERGSGAEGQIVFYIAAIGTLIGSVSGIVLGLMQWLGLKKHIPYASHWILPTTITSALMFIFYLGLSYWFTRGTIWN
jgi:hypothetical protein